MAVTPEGSWLTPSSMRPRELGAGQQARRGREFAARHPDTFDRCRRWIGGTTSGPEGTPSHRCPLAAAGWSSAAGQGDPAVDIESRPVSIHPDPVLHRRHRRTHSRARLHPRRSIRTTTSGLTGTTAALSGPSMASRSTTTSSTQRLATRLGGTGSTRSTSTAPPITCCLDPRLRSTRHGRDCHLMGSGCSSSISLGQSHPIRT